MTIEEAEAILMYEDIKPPKQNFVWGAIKWLVGKILKSCVFIVNFVTISFFLFLLILFIIG